MGNGIFDWYDSYQMHMSRINYTKWEVYNLAI